MQVTGAVIREQGIDFAVVVVKPHVIATSHEAAEAITGLTLTFRVPVVLMAQLPGAPDFLWSPGSFRFHVARAGQCHPLRRYTIN